MRLRIAPQAEADLHSIWYYVATESASVEIADHLVDSLTSRFLLLSRHPMLAAAASSAQVCAASPYRSTSSSTPSSRTAFKSCAWSMDAVTSNPSSASNWRPTLSEPLHLAYSSSLTCSIHSTTLPSSFSCTAMCVMPVVRVAPCQCFSPGENHTTSPGRISSTGPPIR